MGKFKFLKKKYIVTILNKSGKNCFKMYEGDTLRLENKVAIQIPSNSGELPNNIEIEPLTKYNKYKLKKVKKLTK